MAFQIDLRAAAPPRGGWFSDSPTPGLGAAQSVDQSMTIDDASGARHAARVGAWATRIAELPPAEQIEAFEQAFGAVWRRANETLGDVTLLAVLRCVLDDAVRRLPVLACLAVDRDGLKCERSPSQSNTLVAQELLEGMRLVLTEFLSVVGGLTAEILTPALHAALASTSASDMARGEPGSGGDRLARTSRGGRGLQRASAAGRGAIRPKTRKANADPN
jgi:hypothetical protein